MSFDPEHGGFGSAPKFPRSHELSFLLHHQLFDFFADRFAQNIRSQA